MVEAGWGSDEFFRVILVKTPTMDKRLCCLRDDAHVENPVSAFPHGHKEGLTAGGIETRT